MTHAQAFLEGERLEDSESWFCKRCKKLVQADKKLDLWSLPEVLVVHLKRFSYSHRFRDKIDALVNFPLTGLDLSGATLQPQVESACSCLSQKKSSKSVISHLLCLSI